MQVRRLEALSRAELARLGREFMLYGHIYDRALMPQVGMRLGGGRRSSRSRSGSGRALRPTTRVA